MIIAIDGTSGSGKSTLAKALAKQLNFGFFSAGAFYRAITVKALDLKIAETDDEKLLEMINETEITYTFDGTKNVMILDGIDVSERLHNEQISSNVAKYSCKPYIREFVRKLQKEVANNNENIVMEGRDIGSVIFPNADLKIYVDCTAEERARRRFADYSVTDKTITLEDIVKDLKDRDFRDMHREISPLVMCENALLIDTTSLPVQECLKRIYNEMLKRNLATREFFEKRNIEI